MNRLSKHLLILQAILYSSGICWGDIGLPIARSSREDQPQRPSQISMQEASSATLTWTFTTDGTTAKSLTGATAVNFAYGPSSQSFTQAITGVASDLANGQVQVNFTPANTATNGTFAFDLEVVSNSVVYAFAYGTLTLVTRPNSWTTTGPVGSSNIVDWSGITSQNPLSFFKVATSEGNSNHIAVAGTSSTLTHTVYFDTNVVQAIVAGSNVTVDRSNGVVTVSSTGGGGGSGNPVDSRAVTNWINAAGSYGMTNILYNTFTTNATHPVAKSGEFLDYILIDSGVPKRYLVFNDAGTITTNYQRLD